MSTLYDKLRPDTFSIILELAPHKTTPNMDGIAAAIEARKDEWKKHFLNNDMLSTSQIYSLDCKLMPQGKETVIGRETIPKDLMELRNKGGSAVEWNTLEIGPMDGSGDVIFERGEYKFLKPDGSSVYEGKHVVVWKKVSGVYEMYIDIYNENK